MVMKKPQEDVSKEILLRFDKDLKEMEIKFRY